MMHRPSKSFAGLSGASGQQTSTIFLENHRKSLKANQNINFFRKHRKMSGGSKSNTKVS
jgi:hypothetical protein